MSAKDFGFNCTQGKIFNYLELVIEFYYLLWNQTIMEFTCLTKPNLTKVSFFLFLQNIVEKRNYNRLIMTKL